MTAISLWLRSKLSPYLRGGLYYAVFFAVVSIFFSYTNVAYIERGITGVQLGTLGAVGSIVSLIASPLLTGLADRKHWHIPFVALGNLLFGFSVIMINFSPTFAILLGWSAFGAIVKAPTNPIANGLLVRMANKYRINFGQMRIWGSISFTIFCISAGWLWDKIGLEWLFWIGGSLFFFRALMALLIDPAEKIHQPSAAKPKEKQNWLYPLKDRFFLIYLVGIVLWGCSMNGFFGYVSIYMNQLADSTFLVGIAVALPALTEMPSLFFGDRIIRKIGLLPALLIAVVLLVIVTFVVAFTYNPTWVVILNAARGLGFGFWIIVSVRYVDSRSPADMISTYQSLSSIATYTIPALIFNPILGYVYDTLGVNSTFLVSGGMGILTILVLVWLQILTIREEKKTASQVQGQV